MNTQMHVRLAGDLAEPGDPLILPVEVGGHTDCHGEYHRWARYVVRFNFRTGEYEAAGVIEAPWGGDTDALLLGANTLPALHSALADLEVAF